MKQYDEAILKIAARKYSPKYSVLFCLWLISLIMQYKNISGIKYMIKVVNGKFCNVETIILQTIFLVGCIRK